MYKDYFSFSEAPFSIAPDPRYLYMSGRHREALAHLLYGVENDGGFVLLTGDVGTGKTTVCRCLLENLPEHCDVAFIYNPKLDVQELLATICEEFGIKVHGSNPTNKIYVLHINAFLLEAHAKGRKAVLIIDEAQNLAVDVLEQLRLLTNLETNERKLLQIILLGQPELQELLAKKELRQLAQRIVARYHLLPLSKDETFAYVKHRLTVAGSDRQLFPSPTLRGIYRLSEGVPRVINLLCDRALLGAFVQGKDRVDRATVNKAGREVFGEAPVTGVRAIGWALVALALVSGSAALAIVYYQQSRPAAAPKLAVAAQALPRATPATPATAAPAAPPAAPAAEPAVPMTANWIEPLSNAGSEAAAYAALFKRWGASYEGTLPPCKAAEGLGLRCLSDRGGLAELRALNVPALLPLRNEQGRVFLAVLTGLTDKNASFAVGDAETKVPLAALAEHWNGEYTVLWRLPPDYRGPIVPASKGAASEWLARELGSIKGEPIAVDALAQQLKAFQVGEGLEPDGRAGPKTLIHIIAHTDAGAPKLAPTPGGR